MEQNNSKTMKSIYQTKNSQHPIALKCTFKKHLVFPNLNALYLSLSTAPAII